MRTAIVEDPEGLRAKVEALLSAGQHALAWAEITRSLRGEPSTAACVLAAELVSRLDAVEAGLVQVRVAVLGSFTLDPLQPLLTARALRSRLAVSLYMGGFNTWRQEAVDPTSGLRRFLPEILFLAVRGEDLCPTLTSQYAGLSEAETAGLIADLTGQIEDFIQSFRAWSDARVVLPALPYPASPALGILDHQVPHGQTAAVRQANSALADLVKRYRDVWLLDTDRLVRSVGAWRWGDSRLWGLARLPLSGAALHALAEEYVTYLRAFTGLSRKVLVLDLDNTLWGGVVGEDGPTGIQLGPDYPGSAYVEFQRVVLGLHQRGVVLAINSHNNEGDALEALEGHPAMLLRPHHFAAVRVNWQDKERNMLELSEELGLGLDSFVYLDDSQVECERMWQALPHVWTVDLHPEPAERPDLLRRLSLFDTLTFSAEDRRRGELYQQEMGRKRLLASAPSPEDFYRSLMMDLTIERVGPATLSRAAQLSQRTNQFNLTTRRYTEADLTGMLASATHEVYGVKLRDRFGDSGMVGLLITEREGGRVIVNTFLLSCRVLGRTVEDAALIFLLHRARRLGAGEVVGVFRPTAKNAAAADFFSRNGFQRISDTGGETRWRLDAIAFDRSFPDWFTVHLPAEI
jgi:FkbH-like protein